MLQRGPLFLWQPVIGATKWPFERSVAVLDYITAGATRTGFLASTNGCTMHPWSKKVWRNRPQYTLGFELVEEVREVLDRNQEYNLNT